MAVPTFCQSWDKGSTLYLGTVQRQPPCIVTRSTISPDSASRHFSQDQGTIEKALRKNEFQMDLGNPNSLPPPLASHSFSSPLQSQISLPTLLEFVEGVSEGIWLPFFIWLLSPALLTLKPFHNSVFWAAHRKSKSAGFISVMLAPQEERQRRQLAGVRAPYTPWPLPHSSSKLRSGRSESWLGSSLLLQKQTPSPSREDWSETHSVNKQFLLRLTTL